MLGTAIKVKTRASTPSSRPSFPVNLNSTAPNQLRGAYHGSECVGRSDPLSKASRADGVGNVTGKEGDGSWQLLCGELSAVFDLVAGA